MVFFQSVPFFCMKKHFAAERLRSLALKRYGNIVSRFESLRKVQELLMIKIYMVYLKVVQNVDKIIFKIRSRNKNERSTIHILDKIKAGPWFLESVWNCLANKRFFLIFKFDSGNHLFSNVKRPETLINLRDEHRYDNLKTFKIRP